MSKRAPQFERRERDAYMTPPKAVLPLKRFIRPWSSFYEPCAADGGLARALVAHLDLVCAGVSDIVPLRNDVVKLDAHELDAADVMEVDQFVTNPPWERDLLHSIINTLKWLRPTWLLLDADWLFTRQAAQFIPDATHIVAIGRVQWIPGSESVGKDNACWVRFVGGHDAGPKFYPNW